MISPLLHRPPGLITPSMHVQISAVGIFMTEVIPAFWVSAIFLTFNSSMTVELITEVYQLRNTLFFIEIYNHPVQQMYRLLPLVSYYFDCTNFYLRSARKMISGKRPSKKTASVNENRLLVYWDSCIRMQIRFPSANCFRTSLFQEWKAISPVIKNNHWRFQIFMQKSKALCRLPMGHTDRRQGLSLNCAENIFQHAQIMRDGYFFKS